jgi:hypothetical protein
MLSHGLGYVKSNIAIANGEHIVYIANIAIRQQAKGGKGRGASVSPESRP